jgi:hypothetical protein
MRVQCQPEKPPGSRTRMPAVLLLSACAWLPGLALAEDMAVYGGLGLGYAVQSVDQPALIVGPGQTLSRGIEGSDRAVRPFLGLRLHRHVGVEIGYVDFGSVNDTNPGAGPGGGVIQVTDNLSTDGFEAMLLGIWPLSRDFELFGKLGVISWDSDRGIDGVAAPSADGEDLGLGFGVNYLGTERLRFRVEGMRYELGGYDESITVTASIFYALGFGD